MQSGDTKKDPRRNLQESGASVVSLSESQKVLSAGVKKKEYLN